MKDLRVGTLRVDDQEYIVVSRSIPTVVAETRLTRAEHEVATLVALGLSNAEIAARRRRAERTIANQVASVLLKLGLSSRHQVGTLLRSTE
jgi:DNA-binding NarL/FixJ family response regulator